MSFYLVTWVACCQREHVILFGHMGGPLSEGTCHFIWLHGWPIVREDMPFYVVTWMAPGHPCDQIKLHVPSDNGPSM
jgi:hypothetical protein